MVTSTINQYQSLFDNPIWFKLQKHTLKYMRFERFGFFNVYFIFEIGF
jgi:hypothetical protein